MSHAGRFVLVFALVACASRPDREPAQAVVQPSAPPPFEVAPIDVWISASCPEAARAEVAKALGGHPPPRHGTLPPYRVLRSVKVLGEESWAQLMDLAFAHARAVDADGVVIVCRSELDLSGWIAGELAVVRYELRCVADPPTR